MVQLLVMEPKMSTPQLSENRKRSYSSPDITNIGSSHSSDNKTRKIGSKGDKKVLLDNHRDCQPQHGQSSLTVVSNGANATLNMPYTTVNVTSGHNNGNSGMIEDAPTTLVPVTIGSPAPPISSDVNSDDDGISQYLMMTINIRRQPHRPLELIPIVLRTQRGISNRPLSQHHHRRVPYLQARRQFYLLPVLNVAILKRLRKRPHLLDQEFHINAHQHRTRHFRTILH